ncbi:MAG: enoyl-CoA hydratase-related protein [Gemmataceae bacterium]
MSDPAVRVEVRPDRVAVLTIDQPGAKVNVLTVALWDELEAALDALPSDLAGLVIASGKPGCFIAGADLKLLADATPGDPAVKAFIEQGLRVLAKLEALPFPTCAAIDGVALGGGLEVALACEYRLAGVHPRVQFALPEVHLGLIPGWGGTQRLPRIVGWETVIRMLYDGSSLDRVAAHDAMLVDVTSSDGLVDWAARLTPGPRRFGGIRAQHAAPVPVPEDYRTEFPDPPDSDAGRELRRLLKVAASMPTSDGIALETEAFLRLAGSDESRAKIAAFFAARKR